MFVFCVCVRMLAFACVCNDLVINCLPTGKLLNCVRY